MCPPFRFITFPRRIVKFCMTDFKMGRFIPLITVSMLFFSSSSVSGLFWYTFDIAKIWRAQVGGIWRPLDLTLSTDDPGLQMISEPIQGLVSCMGRSTILLEPHLVPINIVEREVSRPWYLLLVDL